MNGAADAEGAEPPVGSEAFEPAGRRVLRKIYAALDGPRRDGPDGAWWVRAAILRALGFVYFFAFVGAALQLPGLIGERGLLPVGRWLEHVERLAEGDAWRMFELVPSVFWLDHSDTALLAVSIGGAVLSAAVVLGLTNALAMLALWASYLSIETVGQRWYAFGWESQLLETGMLAVFLCPLRSWRPFPERDPPSRIAIGLFRWLSFRIWLGAGLIKWRGDPCWQDLTCLDYHFETQPIPNPLSPAFHHLPEAMLAGGVLLNHFVELVVPFMVFGPRRLRLFAAAAMIGFQVVLILSGNLAFLHWLTIVPALACLDDRAIERLMPGRLRRRLPPRDPGARPTRWRTGIVGAYAVLVAYLSIPVVGNLLNEERQAMNRNYDWLQLVNTYGAFGSVGSERFELVVEVTDDPDPDAARWHEVRFACKPGAVAERPCFTSPYHHRLDWLMWFAGLEVPRGRIVREAWIGRLVDKLLANEPSVVRLLDDDWFENRTPRWVRIDAYRYTFARGGADAWWEREHVQRLVPPTDRESEWLRTYRRRYGFERWP